MNKMKIKISVISIFKWWWGLGKPPAQVFNIILQLITSRYDKYLV